MSVKLRGNVDLKEGNLTLWVQADVGDTRSNPLIRRLLP